MKKITLFLFLIVSSTNLITSCSKSSSDETQAAPSPSVTAYSNAFDGVYSGTGTGTGISGTGTVTLASSGSTTGSYYGKIGNVLLVEITNNGGYNFKAKNKLSGDPITLSFSGTGNKNITIVDGTTSFVGTKP